MYVFAHIPAFNDYSDVTLTWRIFRDILTLGVCSPRLYI